MMRRIALATVSVLTLMTMTAAPAAAFDKCKPDLSATGKKDDGMGDAMQKAISAWKRAVTKKYEDDYASWSYAGDNKIACKWNTEGDEFTCTATAKPCKPDAD